LPFSYLHVFPYSARAGTEAAGLPGHVDSRVTTRRSAILRDIGRAKSDEFQRGLIGHVENVLVLETLDRATGRLVGLTGNFVETVFSGPPELMRTLTRIRITGVQDDRTIGELEPDGSSD
jgi:threonylcarbamoyladenosine tRNA methylthiotransferase MtaB